MPCHAMPYRTTPRYVDDNTGGGDCPFARNAATITPTAEEGRLLIQGGWEPFVRTFSDSWLLSVRNL